MSKGSGLGDQLLIGGNVVGKGVQSYTLASPLAALDVTDITQSAHARIGGLRDGSAAAVAYHDPAAGGIHDVLKTLPRADTLWTLLRGQALGAVSACLQAKQLNYDPTRSNTGELTFKVDASANGYGIEYGKQLTPGVRTDAAPADGASLDDGAGFVTPAVPASLAVVTNAARLPATVVITGGNVTDVEINGASAGAGAGTYTVPGNGTIALTYTVAPAWTWTLQSAYGAQAYLQAIALTGTSAIVTVEQSDDNAAWTPLLSFTAAAAGGTWQRQAVSNTTTVGRYLRAVTAGDFTDFVFEVTVIRNETPGVVF